MAEHRPLIGWCEEHEDMALVYDDGSIGCYHLAVIESYSDDCRVIPIPAAMLLRSDGDGT